MNVRERMEEWGKGAVRDVLASDPLGRGYGRKGGPYIEVALPSGLWPEMADDMLCGCSRNQLVDMSCEAKTLDSIAHSSLRSYKSGVNQVRIYKDGRIRHSHCGREMVVVSLDEASRPESAWLKEIGPPRSEGYKHTVAIPESVDILPCGCRVPERREVVLVTRFFLPRYSWDHWDCRRSFMGAPSREMSWHDADSRGLLGHF